MEKKNIKISSKNYLTVIVVSVILVISLLYVRNFILSYRNSVQNVSVFTDNIQSVNINDLEYVIPELSEAIIYVGYRGNSSVRSMENKLYKNIEKESLKDKVYYLDVTEYLDNNEYITILKNTLPNVSNYINTAPMFIVVSSGEVVDVRSSELKMVDSKVFEEILKDYSIE